MSQVKRALDLILAKGLYKSSCRPCNDRTWCLCIKSSLMDKGA